MTTETEITNLAVQRKRSATTDGTGHLIVVQTKYRDGAFSSTPVEPRDEETFNRAAEETRAQAGELGVPFVAINQL